MKKVRYVTFLGAYLFSKVHICDSKIAYLDDIAQFGNLTLWFALFRSHAFTKIIKEDEG